MSSERTCFVIAPIGDEGSPTRKRSDDVLRYIITPALKECGYVPVRADQIDRPGVITSQVIEHIIRDPMVIADLTDHNPNVFYELALRHVTKKPIIHLIHQSQRPPFDVSMNRAIFYDHEDVPSVDECRTRLVAQIQSLEGDPGDIDNPISVSVDLQALRGSGNPLEQSYAEIVAMLQDMKQVVSTFPGARYWQMPSDQLEQLILAIVQELASAGHLRLTMLGVPSHEAADLARRLQVSWDGFQVALDRMSQGCLIIGQGAAGSTYVQLSDLGRRLAQRETETD